MRDRGNFPVARPQNRGLQVAIPRRLAIAVDALEQHLNTIARLQIRVEVDFTAKDFGKYQSQLHVLAERIERADERRVLFGDRGVDSRQLDRPGDGDHVDVERRLAARGLIPKDHA